MKPPPSEQPVSVLTWVGFIAMCTGMFMAVLDIQVVASSFPNIGAALHISEDRLSWIQTCYLTAEIIAIPLTGFLTRALTVRWLFAGATYAFTLASIGCALSTNFAELVSFRTLQGFFGGALIPAVFTTIFELFPRRLHTAATVIAGTFAMIAPTIGPAFGGFLTETYSWHAIFLVNVIPGVVFGSLVALLIRVGKPDLRALANIDYLTVLLAAVFLASLELLLKEGPKRHWSGAFVDTLLAVCPIAFAFAIHQCLTRRRPFLDLRRFADRGFAAACFLSFILGTGLYGSVYLLPLFLGLVRHHSALGIGEIMVVAGAAQLISAPIAAILEPRMNGRAMVALGYGLFMAGLAADSFCTIHTDFAGLVIPQILRGAGIMFCIIPSTRLAMEGWPHAESSDASAQFNLMRNLGGAIGIALVDTLVQQRTAGHGNALVARLQAGDPHAAEAVGLPAALFHGHAMGPVSDTLKQMIAPMVQRAALTQSLNEGWLLLAALFLSSLVMIALLRRRDFSLEAYSTRNKEDRACPPVHEGGGRITEE
ncbi:MAG TPA: DHA2 family efflux MFS transporter permease subunit [Rhizomicrobium sp.]|nr:DHA2 family efflux MFS transporter permease subunit [Rhizomicrobium sp.]